MQIDNVNVESISNILKPVDVKKIYPSTNKINDNIINTRNQIRKILSGEDKRMLVIVGPCSIHDPKAALEYANLSNQVFRFKHRAAWGHLRPCWGPFWTVLVPLEP